MKDNESLFATCPENHFTRTSENLFNGQTKGESTREFWKPGQNQGLVNSTHGASDRLRSETLACGPSQRPKLDQLIDSRSRESSCALFEKHKEFWNVAESGLALGTGAWAAKKYGGTIYSPTRTLSYVRSASRTQGMANSFGSTTASLAGGMMIDRLLWNKDQKMETTVAIDCLLNPVISLSKVSMPSKIGWMIAGHLGARIYDHYRQPKQNFECERKD